MLTYYKSGKDALSGWRNCIKYGCTEHEDIKKLNPSKKYKKKY